ncbi:MAG: hypothetical protein AABY06_00720 [Nanoarchaeota archaeon]
MITKEISKKIREGVSSILEMKITEIEKKIAEKNKEIFLFTIPFLNLCGNLKEYLPNNKIKELNLRYENAISKYWSYIK